MMNKKVETAFNGQINEEQFSEHLYMAMAAYFDDLALTGFSHWMRCQAMEEHYHALRFYNTIVERGGRVALKAIKEPRKEWKSPGEAFEEAHDHEKHITACIHKLLALARKEGDFASEPLLQWFVNEQIEEEASTEEVARKLSLLGDNVGAGLLQLDRELGARTFTMPLDFFGGGAAPAA